MKIKVRNGVVLNIVGRNTRYIKASASLLCSRCGGEECEPGFVKEYKKQNGIAEKVYLEIEDSKKMDYLCEDCTFDSPGRQRRSK